MISHCYRAGSRRATLRVYLSSIRVESHHTSYDNMKSTQILCQPTDPLSQGSIPLKYLGGGTFPDRRSSPGEWLGPPTAVHREQGLLDDGPHPPTDGAARDSAPLLVVADVSGSLNLPVFFVGQRNVVDGIDL
jgi:hypothetical protein